MTRRFFIKLFVNIYVITKCNFFVEKEFFFIKKILIKKEQNLHWILNEYDL
mgnify:CR=1 FL=1